MGIKYTYTVLPVLKADDAATISESLEDEVKLTGEKYANLNKVQTIGYTAGYGLNLEASKAEYTDRVVLTWDIPTNNDKKERYPIIYYKAKNASSWTKVKDLTDSKRNYYVFDSIPSADRLEPLEFAVTYNGSFATASATDPTDKAYKKYLAKIENAQIVAGEAKSIGYMFTLPAITGTKTEETDYSEKALWKTYNTESDVARAVGPESYTLSLKNLNNNADYKSLVAYDKDGENGTVTTYGWADATITQNNATGTTTRTVTVKPNFLNTDAGAGVHNGLLKVQRDYKHWYQITASRTSKADYYKFSSFDDEKIAKPASTIVAHSEDYACRKITDKEFAKCIGLIICDAINKTSVSSGGSNTCAGNAGGAFYLEHTSTTKTVKWGTNNGNYQHIFDSGNVGDTTKPIISGWTIKLDNAAHRRSADGHNLYYLCTNNDDTGGMKVFHETGFASYGGASDSPTTVNFTMGEQGSKGVSGASDGVKTSWKYEFYKNSTKLIDISSNQTSFKIWFPFDIGTSLGQVYKSTNIFGNKEYCDCHQLKYAKYSEGHDIDGKNGKVSLPEYEKTWWQEQ